MKIFKLFIALFLLQSSVSAQVIKILDEMHFHMVMIGDQAVFEDYSQVQGSPYLDENFVESKVFFKNDSVYKIALRYNIFDKRMEYKYNNMVYAVVNPENIKKIELGDKTFIYFYRRDGSKYEDYYQLILAGKASLLLKRNIIFRKAEKSNGIVEGKPDRFLKNQDKYFVYISGADLQQLKNKKSISGIFKTKTKEMETFMKKEKISLKKQNDLIRLITYYNKMEE